MIGVNASVNRIIAIAKPSACSANENIGLVDPLVEHANVFTVKLV
jgi:hypothetical protein